MPQSPTPEETGLLEAAAEAPPADDFISIVEEPKPVLPTKPADPGAARLKAFLEKVAEARKPPPPPAPPPARTERQQTQLELEMEAGRKTAERHAAQAAYRPQPKPNKAEGTSTPVFRPQDFVPSLNSKSDIQRGHKAL